MAVRIRTLFRPVTYSLAFIIDRLNFSPNLLIWLSYITAVSGFVSMFLLIDNAYSDTLVAAALASIFLNGISAEAIYEYTKRKAMVSELERLEFFFDKYTDIFIIVGASLFIGDEKYGILYLNSINALIMAGLIIIGAVGRDILAGKEGQRTRGERMFILGIIGFIGYRFNPTGTHFYPFKEYIFYGMSLILIITGVSMFNSLKPKTGMPRFQRPTLPGLDVRRRLEGVAGILGSVRLPQIPLRVPKVPKATRERRPTGETYEAPDEKLALHNFTVLVAEEGTEDGIAGAQVRLLNKETGESITLETDLEGRTTFEDMPEGQYVITVKAEGFILENFDRYISTDTGDVLYINRSSQDLSVVVNDDVHVRPVPNVVVSLLSKRSGTLLMRKTDNLGVAYFENLDKGVYKIATEAPGYIEGRGTVDLAKENMYSFSLQPVDMEKGRPDPAELGSTAFIQYGKGSGIEDIVVDIVGGLREGEKEVFLVCSPSKAGMYGRRLKEVKIITLPTEGSAPTDDEAIDAIPMTNLEYFRPVFDGMPGNGVMVFEPLSNLILNLGIDAAYKFISTSVDYLSSKDLGFHVLINSDVHDKREISSFENLFLNHFKIDKGRLNRIK